MPSPFFFEVPLTSTIIVFSFVIDDYISGRFFNRVTQGVAIIAVIETVRALAG